MWQFACSAREAVDYLVVCRRERESEAERDSCTHMHPEEKTVHGDSSGSSSSPHRIPSVQDPLALFTFM